LVDLSLELLRSLFIEAHVFSSPNPLTSIVFFETRHAILLLQNSIYSLPIFISVILLISWLVLMIEIFYVFFQFLTSIP